VVKGFGCRPFVTYRAVRGPASESLPGRNPRDMKSADDLETAFAKINDSEVEALLAIAGGLTFTIGAEIADRALAAHLPLCSPFRETVMAGGLVSLGPDYSAMALQAASQIDKIIKGARPADIPVEQPLRGSGRNRVCYIIPGISSIPALRPG
jgi:hypothetical protein